MPCAARVSNNNLRSNFYTIFFSVSNEISLILPRTSWVTNYKTFLKKLLAVHPKALIVGDAIRWIVQIIAKPLNSEHLWVLKNESIIKRCPLLEGSLTKIVIFGTKHFVRYSRHVCYLGCPLLRGFTVWPKCVISCAISLSKVLLNKECLTLRTCICSKSIPQFPVAQ